MGYEEVGEFKRKYGCREVRVEHDFWSTSWYTIIIVHSTKQQ